MIANHCVTLTCPETSGRPVCCGYTGICITSGCQCKLFLKLPKAVKSIEMWSLEGAIELKDAEPQQGWKHMTLQGKKWGKGTP
jgi:hypothetical protein